MTKAGERLIAGITEAAAIAKGEIAAGRIYFEGRTYVEQTPLTDAGPDLYAALADLVDLIDKVAPEYSESPMASNARIALSKDRSQPIPEGGEK